MAEAAIIEILKRHLSLSSKDTLVGIGDDAAIIKPSQQPLVITTDYFCENKHFNAATAPEDIGYKSLAINLSDLAAMAAVPRWFTCAIGHPNGDAAWFKAFAQGMRPLCQRFQLDLIGGDLIKSDHIMICCQLIGQSQHLLRMTAASPGDNIYVIGALGAAAASLWLMGHPQHREALPSELIQSFDHALKRPVVYVELMQTLGPFLHAATDLSDGLVKSAFAMRQQSAVAMQIDVAKLPYAQGLSRLDPLVAERLACAGGDDYALLVTAPAAHHNQVVDICAQFKSTCSRVGQVSTGDKLQWSNAQGAVSSYGGFDHFK